MVLTNFECWAHGGAVIGNDGMPLNSRHMDMFNPRLVQQRLNTAADGTSSVSHISSNGYYGFSYVNAAHELTNNNNPALTQNANNNNTCVPNANDVNGMPSMMHNSMDVGVSVVGAAAAAAGAGAAGTTVFGTGLNATQRCKKRYFVSDDDYANCALLNDCDSGVAAAAGLDVCASKRCRFDDDYAAAQYCNGKRNWRTINCDNFFINQNATNQNNQQHYNNNNQDVRHLNGNAATYNPMDCVGSDRVEHSVRSSCEGAAKDFRNNQFGVNKSAKEQTFPLSQAKFPAFTNGHHHHSDNNAPPGAIVGNSNNEDSAGIAALYATTHGGAFYQYTADSGGNQTYVEDI
ncbi:unnamed protein product [Ceratitis capitata]|uniref:(Mediterranean fruit fly) hypothetical protein n=1 Tax=Ceratitis capitata TaxID=7213 RepID=A0A811V4L8_CERCA|nr:unnamed protein product [Ceratitis capitata]